MVTDGCLFIFVDFGPRFLLGRCWAWERNLPQRPVFCAVRFRICGAEKDYMPRKLAGVRTRIVSE